MTKSLFSKSEIGKTITLKNLLSEANKQKDPQSLSQKLTPQITTAPLIFSLLGRLGNINFNESNAGLSKRIKIPSWLSGIFKLM